ncbi:MAG: RyR domain-containing protein [Solirubrobacterales bacterium]
MSDPTAPESPFAGQSKVSWAFRRFWRRRVRPTWRELQAPLVLLAAIAVVVFGTIGYSHSSREDFDGWEAFFKSFQLFGFAGGDVNSDDPLSLNFAKILGPLLVGYAAIRGLLVLSREQLRLLGFRIFRRNHVVVAGLGDVGFRLADVLNQRGARVIAIDRDLSAASVEGCRERGISVLAGDATDPDTLHAACVDRAAHLLVAPGADAATIDIVAAASGIAPGRAGRPLHILAHIEGRVLWRAMQARALSVGRSGGPKVELFNLYEAAGRLLLDEHAPFDAAHGRSGPRVLIVSDQPLGEILVVNVARLWRNARSRDRSRIQIDFAARDAEQACRGMTARYPALDRVADLEPWPLEIGAAELRSDRAAGASSVYVALGDEADGLATALMIAGARRSPPGVVLVTNDELLGAATVAEERATGAVEVFGILSRTLTPEFLDTGLTELLARSMHESYLRDQFALGKTPDDLPNLVPWDELPKDAKQANRDFATDIAAKLREVKRVAVPTALVDLDRDGARFEPDEIERLAELEHERWVRDKQAAGFAYGPERDDDARVHPSLRPYAELPEPEKDKDRTAIRDLPRMLADAGFAIERL